MVYSDDFDIVNALKEHLLELEEQRNHVESLIRTVKQTMQQVKGECEISDVDKFEAFKESLYVVLLFRLIEGVL